MGAALLGALLLLAAAAPCPGQRARRPVFQPSFIHMSGPRVNALFLGNASGVNFSLVLSPIDEETGKMHHSNCSGSRRAGDWNLSVKPGGDISKVTVSLTRNLQLCLPNATDCCTSPLCVVETLQVLACHGPVMLAHLLIQAEIYANSSVTGNVSENATIIPNQAFQPLGSCPCDLTAGACDVRCCCDQECTSDLKQLFTGSCFTGVFGGDVNPPFDQLCSSKTMEYTPDWFPFLCVQSSLDNTPFLGYFYHGFISTPRDASFKIPLQMPPGRLFTGYREGDPIMTEENDYFTIPQKKVGYNRLLLLLVSDMAVVYTLSIPLTNSIKVKPKELGKGASYLFLLNYLQQSMAGQCVGNAPVAFLRDFDVRCLTHLASYSEGLPHDVRVNSGTGDFIQQNVIYGTITDIDKFITKSESPPTTEVPCKNVTFAEHYEFIWEGKNIKEINVTVFQGNLCDGEILTQRFTVKFISLNNTNETEPSGNPGYQVGKPLRAANLNASDTFGSLKLWQPGLGGLCTSAAYTPVLFGLDSLCGCMLEVGVNEDCNLLRENVIDKLNSLIQATHIGKRINSSYSNLNDWVEIIRLDPDSSDTNVSAGNLKGICSDVPANLNIRIIFATVGAVQGIPRQEILAVQISYSTVIWQFQCGLTCENVDFLPITASVQFIKVPAQPPIPLTRFQINYTEFDCDRNDVCWPQLFYPLTRFYTGEPYPQCLAKTLAVTFVALLAAITSSPWFHKVLENGLL